MIPSTFASRRQRRKRDWSWGLLLMKGGNSCRGLGWSTVVGGNGVSDNMQGPKIGQERLQISDSRSTEETADCHRWDTSRRVDGVC